MRVEAVLRPDKLEQTVHVPIYTDIDSASMQWFFELYVVYFAFNYLQ